MTIMKMLIVFLVAIYTIQATTSEVYSETEQLAILGRCPECTTREYKNISFSPKCLECFCDIDCLDYGDCCIDILIQYNLHTEEMNRGLTCYSPPVNDFQPIFLSQNATDLPSTDMINIKDLVPDGDAHDTDTKNPNANLTYQHIKLLPGAYFGYYMRTHFRYLDNEALCDETFIPVTCNNGVTYTNIGCAFLDKAEDCVPWTIERSKNPSSLHTEYYFVPPASAEVRLCDTRRSNPVISTCTPEFNSLSSLCSKYFSLVVDNVGKVYRNMFCFECNGGKMQFYFDRFINPLISLTQFTDIKEDAILCNGMMSWFDSKARKCRTVMCHGEKTLEDGLCVSKNRTALGSKYHLPLQLELDTTHPTSNLNQIIGHMMSKIEANLHSTSYQIEALHQRHDSDYPRLLLHVWIEVIEDITFTDVEQNLMHIGRWVDNFDFKIVLDSMAYQSNQTEYQVFRYFKSDRKTGLCCFVVKNRIISSELDYLPVTNEFTCPYIEFEPSEYTQLQNSAFIKHFNLTLHHSFFSIFNNKLSVCLHILLSKTSSVRTNETLYISENSSSFDVVLWYVTIACSLLSMLSLVVIIITYTIFKELRTQPGMNNLILSWNLLMAQLILLVGFNRAKDATLCTILGIVTHFFWLSTLFWMNICSYHMFKVFVLGKYLISAPRTTVKLLMIYCIYAYGCSVLIVSGTIVINIIISDGKKLGYGGGICYLSNTVLVLYSFVVPLCLIVISNVIFFILTVITIHRVKQEGKQTGERNNIYIYLKLSVVTGVFWTLSIMTNFFDFDTLEYAAVLLNGSHGVFLLWSLIINKMVLTKYRVIFCKCIPDLQSETYHSKK